MSISLPRAAVKSAPFGSAELEALKARNRALLIEDLDACRPRFRALPEIISLYTTDICNLRCQMCPRSARQGTHVLDRGVLRSVMEDLFPAARKTILTAAAGEPMLADFDLVLECALRYGTYVDMITNGTYLSGEIYRESRWAFDHLNVSVDAATAETYERVRTGGSFDRILGNLEEIREVRGKEPDDVLISLSFLATNENLEELPAFVRMASDLEVQGVLVQRLQHTVKRSSQLDPNLLPKGSLEAILDEARSVARERNMNLLLDELAEESVWARPLRSKHGPSIEGHSTCWFVAQNFGLTYNGDVYPCCIPTDHKLGSVLESSPRAVWNSRSAQELRSAHFSKRGTSFCTGCYHAPHLDPGERSSLGRLSQTTLRRGRLALSHIRTLARERLAPKRQAHPKTRGPVPARRSEPRIFYLCNAWGESGGIKVLYDQVALLRKLGQDALLASTSTFRRCTWFDSSERDSPAVSDLLQLVTAEDIVVVPEYAIREPELRDHPARQVALVQNTHLISGPITRNRFEAAVLTSPVLIQELRAKTGFEGPVHVVPGFLEREWIAPPRETSAPPKRVLLIDREDKHQGQPQRAAEALGRLGVEVSYARAPCPRLEFVQRFAEHDLYLHLSYPESYPVSVLEAFGQGCLVAGFSGGGGLAFMRDRENCRVVPDGDWEAAVDAALELMNADSESLDRMRSKAAECARSAHPDRALEALDRLVGSLLSRPARASQRTA